MNVTISIESSQTRKTKIGVLDDPHYAAALIEALLKKSQERREYIKIYAELSEKEGQ